MRRLIRLIAALSCTALLLGNTNCNKNSDSSAPQFVTSLSVRDSNGNPSSAFAQGDTIELVLTIRNRSNTAQTLFFNSGEALNAAVVQAGTASVQWTCDNDTTTNCLIGSTLNTTSSSGSGFTEIDLAAFQTKSVTLTWNQKDDSGAQVKTGSYEAFAGFTVYNTTGAGDAADNGDSMAMGAPTAAQMFPTVYRATLQAFTIN